MKIKLKILTFIILSFLLMLFIKIRNDLVFMQENVLKNKNDLVFFTNNSINDIDYLNMKTIKIMKYNKNVQEYNTYLNTFPNIIFKSLGHKEFEYFDEEDINKHPISED